VAHSQGSETILPLFLLRGGLALRVGFAQGWDIFAVAKRRKRECGATLGSGLGVEANDDFDVELEDTSLLRGSVMVVADGPGNFPGAVFILPEMNELAFTDALGFLMPRVVETVDADLDRGIALHVNRAPSPHIDSHPFRRSTIKPKTKRDFSLRRPTASQEQT
jgi:hypothetical protein